jgi:hypothetical protein
VHLLHHPRFVVHRGTFGDSHRLFGPIIGGYPRYSPTASAA